MSFSADRSDSLILTKHLTRTIVSDDLRLKRTPGGHNESMASQVMRFQGNGQSFEGYFAPSLPSVRRGVIVIQEWWGLVGHIKEVADRFASAGFHALAPDFYGGKSTSEPDEAGSLMMALNIETAAKVIQGALNELKSSPQTQCDKVGVVGFCMGGQLSMYAATVSQDFKACVNFYGIHPSVQPDFQKLSCPILGLFAEIDDYASPEIVAQLSHQLDLAGKPHEFHTYAGCHHAFFNSDRPSVYNREAAEDAWSKVIEFFEKNL